MVAIALGAVAASSAQALIYWTDPGSGKISRANLNGTGKQVNFITGANSPQGVVATKTHVYWTNLDGNSIGRARIDGTGVNQNFVSTLPGSNPFGITVSGNRLYWTTVSGDTIGRANLNGSGVIHGLVNTGPGSGPRGVAVTGSHIYWGNYNTNTIGRANINGSGVNNSFLAGGGLNTPRSLSLAGGQIYWSNGDSSVARYTIGNGNLNVVFIAGGANPRGVVALGNRLYWTRAGLNEIATSNIAGTSVTSGFITAVGTTPEGIGADLIPTHSNGFKLRKFKANRRKGNGKLAVKLAAPGKLTLTGKGVRKATKSTGKARGGSIKLAVKPKRGLKRKLAARGKVRVKVKVKYKSAVNRKAKTKSKKVTLRLRS